VVTEAPIRPFYDGWQLYNQAIVDVVRDMSDEHLQLCPAPDRWPMWATIAHMAGARAYWLCGVLGEPGLESTPFPDAASGVGWEDDEDQPRTAAELVHALDSTWTIVDGCLGRWTPEMLREGVVRHGAAGDQVHTRQSILMRLISHDAYHAGELSQTLGILHLPQIDLWKPVYVVAEGSTRQG
jgi:uncharacterized damage-inducible protein DinB